MSAPMQPNTSNGETPRERFMDAVRNASMPVGSGCCGKPVGCSMTHKGCLYLRHPYKRSMIYKDPTVRCQKSCYRHDENGVLRGGLDTWMLCVLPRHEGPCELRPWLELEKEGWKLLPGGGAQAPMDGR